MKFKAKIKLFVYALPVAAALLVRALLLQNWWSSPVRWYCNISGLDMQSVLQTGKMFYDGEEVVALYRALLAAILFFNNGTPCPEAVVILQLIGGVIIAPLTAWCALKVWGKPYPAMLSGLFAALYAPAMMYQVLVLKESILLFFALLSLAAVLWAHKRRFSRSSLWICGIFLALACVCRINALPFCGLASLWIIAALFKKPGSRKKVLVHTVFLAFGILNVFIPASIFNGIVPVAGKRIFMPFPVPRLNYIAKVSGKTQPTDLNAPSAPVPTGQTPSKSGRMLRLPLNMLNKAPAVFSASETPNNVNYYFLKYKLFPLKYLVGPYLIIPLAVTALIMLLFNGGILRKESILFVFIFSYMIPLCIFVPLARYRLVLIPVFCMLAPYPLFTAAKYQRAGKTLLAAMPIIIWLLTAYINLPLNSFLRASDFVSYGIGMQHKAGNPAAALPWFIKAYELAPWKQMTVINLADTFLKCRKPEKAKAILIPALQKSPDNPAYRYYLGIAYFFTREPGKAEALFKSIDPKDMADLKPKYYFFYRQSLLAQKKYKAAEELYRESGKDKNGK